MSLINDALKKANQAQKKRPPQGPLGAPIQPVESLKRPPSQLPKLAGGLLALVVGGVSVWAFMSWKSKKASDLAMLHTEGVRLEAAEPSPVAVKPAVEEASQIAPVAIVSKPVEELSPTNVSIQPATVRAKIDTGAAAAATEASDQTGIQRTDMAVLRMPRPLTTPMTDAAVAGTGAPKIAQPSATIKISPPSGIRPSAPSASVETPTAIATSTPPLTARSVPSPAPPTASPGIAKASPVVAVDSTTAASSGSTETTFPNLELQGIFFRLKNPSVMINRRALFVGDRIAGVRIVDIQRRTVTIEKDGQRKELSMSGF